MPFTPHPWGPDYIPIFNETTEDPINDFVDPGSIYFTPSMIEKWEAANDAWLKKERVSSRHKPDVPALSYVADSGTTSVDYSKGDFRLNILVILGGILLLGALVGIWNGRLLHIGKNYKTAAECEGFLKTV